MGGSPRRGVLFEGPPGTGKTYLAKALAAEAGVPFLFVSASEFQSMYFGQTNRKIRTYFKALRKAARNEGGAIGFIEEFDAIGGARSGMNTGSMREGIVGVVNELLVQMQSFDMPTAKNKLKGKFVDAINAFLPTKWAVPPPDDARRQRADHRRHEPRRRPRPGAAAPGPLRPHHPLRSPAARRPGRDRRLLPAARSPTTRTSTRSSSPTSPPATRPVRIERLLDEALIVALRHGRKAMILGDVIEAQMITDVGLSHPVGYHPDERRRVAVHEAGHALVASLVGREVRARLDPAPRRGARRRRRTATPRSATCARRPRASS